MPNSTYFQIHHALKFLSYPNLLRSDKSKSSLIIKVDYSQSYIKLQKLVMFDVKRIMKLYVLQMINVMRCMNESHRFRS